MCCISHTQIALCQSMSMSSSELYEPTPNASSSLYASAASSPQSSAAAAVIYSNGALAPLPEDRESGDDDSDTTTTMPSTPLRGEVNRPRALPLSNGHYEFGISAAACRTRPQSYVAAGDERFALYDCGAAAWSGAFVVL